MDLSHDDINSVKDNYFKNELAKVELAEVKPPSTNLLYKPEVVEIFDINFPVFEIFDVDSSEEKNDKLALKIYKGQTLNHGRKLKRKHTESSVKAESSIEAESSVEN
ncbi:3721_t:CDS:2, partial [Racocetra persica]